MYRKVSLSSFHNGKVEYCTTSGSGDIEENASPVFFTQTLDLERFSGKFSEIMSTIF